MSDSYSGYGVDGVGAISVGLRRERSWKGEEGIDSRYFTFNAASGEVHNGSYSNLVYGKSDTVQPPAYRVYAWRRVS